MSFDHDFQLFQSYSEALSAQAAPLAWLDEVAFEKNIDWLATQSQGKKIRIGSKSLRSLWAIQTILKRNPIFQGVLTMTIPEALWLFERGVNDLLVAYPSAQKADFLGLSQAIRAGARMALMADRPEHLDLIQSYAESEKIEVRVVLDVDVSSDFGPLHFGVYRSSLKTVDDLRQLFFQRDQWNRIRWVGLMAYEAQLAGVPDYFSNVFKRGLVQILKRRSRAQVLERRREAVEWLQHQGIEMEIINGGGTGSLSWTALDPAVTEIAVGSGFYAPVLFDAYQDLNLSPALGFALRVSRQSRPGIVTCTGGGYPASGSAGLDRLPMPYLPPGLSLLPMEGAGEVQTPLRVQRQSGVAPRVGDLVFFRHPKAGELCERFLSLHLIRRGAWIQEVSTYRGEGRQWI